MRTPTPAEMPQTVELTTLAYLPATEVKTDGGTGYPYLHPPATEVTEMHAYLPATEVIQLVELTVHACIHPQLR